ncbi:unnamed protein product [Lactuca saligna]|uniref:Uncharacterized protein n=1 Tax=Lactuca saligna TaxID=75948 RepID=A0AA35YJ78_LACSI|nr:unnamed protein product [Lactuca saligna]
MRCLVSSIVSVPQLNYSTTPPPTTLDLQITNTPSGRCSLHSPSPPCLPLPSIEIWDQHKSIHRKLPFDKATLTLSHSSANQCIQSASLLLQHLMPTEFRPSAELIRQTAGELKLCPNLTCALLLKLCKFTTSDREIGYVKEKESDYFIILDNLGTICSSKILNRTI